MTAGVVLLVEYYKDANPLAWLLDLPRCILISEGSLPAIHAGRDSGHYSVSAFELQQFYLAVILSGVFVSMACTGLHYLLTGPPAV